MEKKLTKGTLSNYEITITVTTQEQEDTKKHVLEHFQKDVEVQGFRKGHAPLDVVEKNVKPEYLMIGLFEDIINHGIQDILKEQPDLKFIGEPYDVKEDKKEDTLGITFKLDVYPEVEIKNTKWEKETLQEVDAMPTKKELDDAIMNLKKNYADYQDTDLIALDTVSKITMEFLNKENEVVEKGALYVGEPEFSEFEFFKKVFVDKKKEEVIEHKYDEKILPPTARKSKTETEPTQVRFTVKDVKKVVLPDLNDETIKKLFGDNADVKTEKDLLTYIEKEISKQKFEVGLIKQVEAYINKVREESMSVAIPKTFIDAEVKARLENLEKQLGGKEKMEEYFNKLGEEKMKKFVTDIQNTAKESLEKFSILMKIANELKVDIDRNNTQHLEVETKLYEKLKGGAKEEKKEAAPKKAPAKKKEE